MFVSTEEPMEGSVGVKVTPVGPRRSRRAGPIHSVVVNLSFRIIGQDFVRLGDLLELLRRVFYVVLVLVGVPFQGELAVPETHISPSNSPQSHNTHAFLISAVVAFFDTSRTL
jgi:hypothetical protein